MAPTIRLGPAQDGKAGMAALVVDGKFGPGRPPAEPFPIPVHSGDVRVDVQAGLAMLAPIWGYGPLLDIDDDTVDDLVLVDLAGVYRDAMMIQSGAGLPLIHPDYEGLAREIDKAMRFMAACGVDFEAMRATEFWSAHEALLLDYERPLTRVDSRSGRPYATSGHMLWVGERTREIDGAHIDFVSRVSNPVGMKVGPKADPDDLLRIIDKIDPEREPGRLTFITRMGAGTIREALPPIVERLKAEGAAPVWITDPMHGNTFESASGFKTRRLDDIVDEVRGFFEVHEAAGTVPGGLHVELTGNDVTECLGGSVEVRDEDLESRYESACDPRLNHQQSLELAYLVAEMLSARAQ